MRSPGLKSTWAHERTAERAALARALSDVKQGRGAVLVLEGPAGIGKTALVGVGVELAQEAGVEVARARAHELEAALPYGAVRTLLAPWAARAAPGPAARVLGTSARDAADVEASEVLHALYSLVAELARANPMAVFVDDAHWLDAASRRFLVYLAQRVPALGMVLVSALRGDEAPELRAHLLGSEGARVVRPAPLGQAAVRALLSERLGRAPAPALVDACHRSTGGIPLLVVELVEALGAASAQRRPRPVRQASHHTPRHARGTPPSS